MVLLLILVEEKKIKLYFLISDQIHGGLDWSFILCTLEVKFTWNFTELDENHSYGYQEGPAGPKWSKLVV